MGDYKVISADTHIVEPPDLYTSRFEPGLRDRAPRIERRTTKGGQDYDVWIVDGQEAGMLGTFVKAGQRFDDPEKIDFLGFWDDVRKAAYDPHEMLKELEMDGVWAACPQPSQGLFWYRLDDHEIITATCRAYNDWIAEFCQPYPDRLKGIGVLNVDDVDEACAEMEHCAEMGLVGVFIPSSPLWERPYRDPVYEKLWWTAQDVDMPLLLHIGSNRGGIPGCELTIDTADLTAAGFATIDYWVRYSMTCMIFAGVFDRYPKLKVGSVEHETAWIPHWLKQMDFIYMERPAQSRKLGWRSKQGFLPTDYWHQNFFVEFMEDDAGIQMRHLIGVDNMLWGNDFPHAESTWPQSMQFLDRIFQGVPDEERRKITSETAAKIFKFTSA
jgi:predicted TIM-barrel fold metal-dependent hydrolase